MDNSSALEEEALAIVSIYGPSSFYALAGSEQATAATPPVYALKVSLEEPDFDYDPISNNNNNKQQDNLSHVNIVSKSKKELELRIYFPEGYPDTNTTAPVHEIVSIYYGSLRLTQAMIQEIDQGLEQCFVQGEVVIFSWIEWLRAYLERLEICMEHGGERNEKEKEKDKDGALGEVEDQVNGGDEEADGIDGDDSGDDNDENDVDDSHTSEGLRAASDYFSMDEASSSLSSLSIHDHPHSPRVPIKTAGSAVVPTFNIRSGPPIIDRKSVFVAHLAPITQPSQVPWMIQQLKQENKKVIKATHNIMAFRVENENGAISQDNDDDGETAAGSRLLHLMSILDVKNVVVVVSRWYGGIPLSADRFKHINNAARQLLDECGYIKPTASSADAASASTNSKNKSKGRKSGRK
ncbi:ribosomal protein S5 domain 2-type protein [Lobosporangium transversale]|uniref:Ribosomal protein S5 domain 2-type protein n=1 Tax=Lobosporangium transversale TaxID=64571 RepID=A0A1Y2GEQ4_9FUNG|nr:ribosomal protein S5 domain 2-type protein [Lobosporangium transversale]ORZ08782.1 ribosomal protein S5 domain 2-type protein [Lobosporangium transversale]|eukprot:XP_021878565.1 ribosomal protein S5 domain 2-type protein [Lobosporangium transversale]